MSSITSAGPEGYEFQYLVTVWVTLMLWEHADLRILPEQGEDFRVECGALPGGSIDVQVKSTKQPFTMECFADILGRFGGRQAERCTFDRLLAGQRMLVIIGGSCASATERYHCNPGELDTMPAVPPEAARDVLTALSTAATQAKEGNNLDLGRRKHLVSLGNWMVTHAQQALRRISVWDRSDETFVRQRCTDMIRRLRIPADQAEVIVNDMVVAVREGAKHKADAMPTLRQIIEDRRIDRYRAPEHIARADEQTFFERLCLDHVVLFSGPPRCGKTEMGRALLDRAADEGYLTEGFSSSEEARQFLSQGGGRHRACLLDDPLGTRGVVKAQGQGMRELRGAVEVRGPGRLLIVAQSRDELLSANGADSLDQCRLPKAAWQALDNYPAGFLSQVWASLKLWHPVPNAKSDAVESLLAEGTRIEVGALEMVAANPDLLSNTPTQDDLWRVFHQEAGDLTQELVQRLDEKVGDLMLILAITTTPDLPVHEREIAFVLSDDEELPGLGSMLRMLISLDDNEDGRSEPPN